MTTIDIDSFYILKNGIEYKPSFKFIIEGFAMIISGYDLLCPYTNEKVDTMNLNKIKLDRLCGENVEDYKMVYKN